MSDPHDDSIPVLNEILVPGRAREASGDATAPARQPGSEPASAGAAPREPAFHTEPAVAPPPAHQTEPTLTPEPVHAPQPRPTHEPAPAAEHAPVAQAGLYRPHVADHTHARRYARPHQGIHARHAHDGVHEEMEVSPGVFDRIEPFIPLEAGATVPPDLAQEVTHEAAPAQPALDADAIAQRLHGRFQRFLTGEGRGIIEARCRDAVQQHTGLLVSQITREVAQTLEAEMTEWVRDAVEEELARRSR
ncbi:DUF2486 family protein [Paraburkholderia sp. MMS20-SJTN17]|uniref:DUF2486 family protein n=1 Tax=Paraburkholderia translucens TaxID=2886945 RepID=A0ABS8K905_9BURK|nr:DUF2486 family protein [Paraburkholderia sp. MMS20-SJTN17]MCC8401147.1 DUF2486 family protein [Paraburkholderia sp. MMS20-SJTN17]